MLLLVALAGALLAAPLALAKTEEGLASFYGRAFQGKKTASGVRFDADELTAAHPSHPSGTILRVTNLENSRAIEVRVTDRGPTRPNRREGVVIDLSRAAAKRIGLTDEGRARVRVEVVKPGRKRP
ncbi:MAG: septal ring lytic transglycosylase RlpA family protein [Candidatus Binatia bacterium]